MTRRTTLTIVFDSDATDEQINEILAAAYAQIDDARVWDEATATTVDVPTTVVSEIRTTETVTVPASTLISRGLIRAVMHSALGALSPDEYDDEGREDVGVSATGEDGRVYTVTAWDDVLMPAETRSVSGDTDWALRVYADVKTFADGGSPLAEHRVAPNLIALNEAVATAKQ